MTDVLAIVLCGIGLCFSLSAALGINRFPDVYSRLQCATKSITMGALPVLGAVAAVAGPFSVFGARVALVAFLLLVLGPASSHALGRAAYRTRTPMWSGAALDEVGARPRRRPRS